MWDTCIQPLYTARCCKIVGRSKIWNFMWDTSYKYWQHTIVYKNNLYTSNNFLKVCIYCKIYVLCVYINIVQLCDRYVHFLSLFTFYTFCFITFLILAYSSVLISLKRILLLYQYGASAKLLLLFSTITTLFKLYTMYDILPALFLNLLYQLFDYIMLL